jgi:hypothetical protein
MSSLQLLNWWCPFPVEVNDQLKKKHKMSQKMFPGSRLCISKALFHNRKGTFGFVWAVATGVGRLSEIWKDISGYQGGF